MPEIEVRQGDVHDAAVVASLNPHVHDLHVAAEPHDFHATEPGEVRAFFELVLTAPTDVVFLAAAFEIPVGYLWAEEVSRPVSPFKNATHVMCIHHVAVDPSCRRQGVGRAMYGALEREARRRGIAHLALDHWTFNSGAAGFFRSLGFENCNVRMRRVLED